MQTYSFANNNGLPSKKPDIKFFLGVKNCAVKTIDCEMVHKWMVQDLQTRLWLEVTHPSRGFTAFRRTAHVSWTVRETDRILTACHVVTRYSLLAI